MLSEELKSLIEASLVDGVLEEHEKAAIVKRAQKEGVDLDELVIYIDSLIQKQKQKENSSISKQVAEQEKNRRGTTCPHCGSTVPPLTKICPICGFAVGGNESIGDKELYKLVDDLTLAHSKVKSGAIKDFDQNKADLERLLLKARTFYSDNKKVQMLVFEIENDLTSLVKKSKGAKRNESRKSFLTNPWTWVAVEIIITLSVIIYFANMIGNDELYGLLGLMYLGGGCIAVVVITIKKFCLKNSNSDKKKTKHIKTKK